MPSGGSRANSGRPLLFDGVEVFRISVPKTIASQLRDLAIAVHKGQVSIEDLTNLIQKE